MPKGKQSNIHTLVPPLIEVEYLTLHDDGILRGPAGKVSLAKVSEALIAGATRRLNNIFNNVKGGYGHMKARDYIKGDNNFDRFITEPRDPSARGLDDIAQMKDNTYHLVETKMYSSRVGPNQVHRALEHKPGSKNQPPEVKIDTKILEADIKARLERQPAAREAVLEALRKQDGSVALRIELIECEATETLAKLNGKVINGVKILVNRHPKGGL